ncbi:hypothetical protein [Mycolicibacterium neoaurum]|uniref:Uncharacterized protein n=1 Tax=Mycolicibacterium neoaurum VKM Ac-1815D TaxID=700508 RepID=V5XHR3_MYCNE|nr:hypothetical protein D174_16700 [Mycolicibacterium neoaurum VKM Ac-1815D]AMO06495.1 hypothetical protein MyAD_16385 [Mycolicibacterium neoaurum]AXK75151.1 hypothetical protein DXK33_08565 [Mycolicibacterium neoaurum]KJQ51158.1 hypothetical protein TS71_07815 [Mycolicibacterium neoaurum]KUM07936.1 hypothetical protein AVZ31_13515 [Mycolicibacterium neoaurum]
MHRTVDRDGYIGLGGPKVLLDPPLQGRRVSLLHPLHRRNAQCVGKVTVFARTATASFARRTSQDLAALTDADVRKLFG